MSDEEREARLALSCVVEPGDPGIGPLVEQYGAADVWRSLVRTGREGAWGARARAFDRRAIEVLARRRGLRFVVPEDADWPAPVEVLGHGEPVRGFGGAPLGLWVRGAGSLADVTATSVALVGSRASSPYGDRVAGDLAAGLAAGGVTVVSGGAFGIDAAAHRGALAGGGPTVAVLAGGLDVPYPRAHEPLLDAVAEVGLLVSELAPGEHPTRRRFLTRNRIIAAMSGATVIVEAALRSGARNTATWARGCGRPVLAVPGPVSSVTSATPHRLIREGEAVLVTSVDEIRESLLPVGAVDLRRPRQPRLFDQLNGEEQAVYEALPGRGVRDVGDLALRAGLTLPACLGALGSLHAQGMAEPAADGGWRLGRVENRPVRVSADEEGDRRHR